MSVETEKQYGLCRMTVGDFEDALQRNAHLVGICLDLLGEESLLDRIVNKPLRRSAYGILVANFLIEKLKDNRSP